MVAKYHLTPIFKEQKYFSDISYLGYKLNNDVCYKLSSPCLKVVYKSKKFFQFKGAKSGYCHGQFGTFGGLLFHCGKVPFTYYVSSCRGCLFSICTKNMLKGCPKTTSTKFFANYWHTYFYYKVKCLYTIDISSNAYILTLSCQCNK